MSEETKKINFLKQVLKSIKDLDKYEDFAVELPKEAFKYLLKLGLIFSIIITLFYSYKIVDRLGEIYTNLKAELPEFSYTDGKLAIDSEEPIIIRDYQDTIGNIIIDTKIEENATRVYESETKNTILSLLLLKDKCIIISNGATGQVIYNYSDLAKINDITEFTKQDVINYVEGINIISIYASIYFMMFIYLFIIYFISIFTEVMMLAVLAFLVSRISRIRLKFGPSFSIAVHSITLPILLNLIYIIVNLLTGFNIKHFQLMYSTISYIYVIVAILMIKTDFINRQLELMKLAEEQEKVRQELQKQKEEKEKESKKEKKDSDKKDKKKKEETEGNLDEGVNPSVIKKNNKLNSLRELNKWQIRKRIMKKKKIIKSQKIFCIIR